MRSPDFWQQDSALARLLDPLGRLYGLAGRARRRITTPWRAPVPVICVGNLTVGGTGKTPLVMALARQLNELGRTPHILTRGYGGRLRGPVLVAPDQHDAAAVGDEPLLLARAAPTWVARDRRLSARSALAHGADVLLMDDGFQNPTLHQGLGILVFDGAIGLGNGRLVPAGPLREPAHAGLERAQAVVIVGDDETNLLARLPPHLQRLRARFRPVGADHLAGRRVLAFAGIGRPAKFYRTLREIGVEIVERRDFPDHHPYSQDELSELLAGAALQDAVPLTTAKDLVRIPRELQPGFSAVDIELLVQPESELTRLLRSTICSPAVTMP